ncbi:MAG: flagellar M-ring protein FliF [Candidatus Eremiobacteraeota bacterium]|nr:flagellar basal-body MS-ring/collar protein FliF [Candidatus Eremiobacteraeota bacterium]NNM92995.1 flagellar M-ring protein FliF [Candidatus Eremiobacteraeota bacterium]
MEQLRAILATLQARILNFWAGQSSQGRALVTGGGIVALLALVGFGALVFGRGPSYSTLFSNLSTSDANAVLGHLKADKVPYHISLDGKSISVPSADVSAERIAIAGTGLIKGAGVGYEIFDRTNFGMTQFQERIDKTRAIEGELERTINGLTPVEASRVSIVTPDHTLYSDSQEPTTASVAIKLRPGQGLDGSQVEGITMLVARSVEGLKPVNVTIVNQDGQILLPTQVAAGNASAQDNALQLTQEQLIAKERYESSLQQSIQSMLDSTLGKGRAVARVSTKMSFDVNTSDGKIYSPQGTVLSAQSARESYNGTQPAQRAAVGVPGTTSNIGTYQALQNATTNGRYNKSKTTTNYDVSVQNIKHIDAPGKVLQTSVAVLVNSTPQTTTAAGGTPAIAAAPYVLTPANVTQIRNVVIAAAGLDLAAGDQVSVEAIPFNPALAQRTVATGVTTVLGIPLWVLLAIGGLGLLGIVGFLATRARESKFVPSTDLPSFDSSLTDELPPFEEHPLLEGAPGLSAPMRSTADMTREQMIEYVTTVAQESPDSIGKLVKLWLAE